MKNLVRRISPNLILIIILLTASLTLAYRFSDNNTSVLATQNDRLIIQEAISTLSNPTLPPATLEWFLTYGGMNSSLLNSAKMTYSVKGTVISVTEAENDLPLQSNYYYTGTPGSFHHVIQIKLRDNTGTIETYLFSPKRKEVLRVVEVQGEREISKTLADIETGDVIEIEESVDLRISAVEDAHVTDLVVRILPQ